MLADRSELAGQSRPATLGRQSLSSRLSVTEWLTLERAGYGLAAIVALALRLGALDAVPLAPVEAIQALPALVGAQVGSPDLAGVSPLLYALQRLTFAVVGPSDGSARFWVALVGGLSPLLFYWLRGRMSRGGALVAALLWSISPLAVWSSRLAVGDALVPTAALAWLAALASSRDWRGWGLGVGLAFGLLLLSGPNACTVLLAALAAGAVLRQEMPVLMAGVLQDRRGVLAGLGITALIATLFGAEPAGLAAAADLPGRWLSDLRPGAGEYAALEMAWRLLLNELLLLAPGIVGAIWALRARNRSAQAVAVGTAVALAVALLGRGRDPLDLSLIALGLVLLAGPVVARVSAQAYEWRSERDPWLLLLASAALLFAASIALPSGLNPANPEGWRSLYLAVGIAAFVLAVVGWVAYGAWDSWQVVRHTLPALLLFVGLAWSVSQMVSLSFDRGAWRQPAILHDVAATDLADLQRALSDLGGLAGGGRDAPIDVAWPDLGTSPVLPMLRWQLRDFEQLRLAAAVPPDPARLVITPQEDQPRLANYRGADFAVVQRWTPAQLPDRGALLRWLLYREDRTPAQKTGLVLWINTNSQR
jgi:4-amino-4-deoxy-L-arabinose transferase-like glycosyltransferase